MAKKVLLKNHDQVEIMPITRGELVLDSSGKMALNSHEFLATESNPGLTNIHYVEVSKGEVASTFNPEGCIIQVKSSSEKVYPMTTSDAVIITSKTGPESLTSVLKGIQQSVANSTIILDERPTEGNIDHGVSSDGIFQELKETVGNIHTLLTKV